MTRGVIFKRNHDLVYLLDCLQGSGLAVPTDIEAVRWLQPYAVTARYELPFDEQSFDRRAVLALVVQVREWSESLDG